tara:strand:- start:111 stop:743 length:633 start_codon:yes stop_codon:yes gene_type:complete
LHPSLIFGAIILEQPMETKPTLLCIPDISGFTKFMRDVDFQLSSEVIPALLNKIIYSNSINFKVSEIEGDAVLFFRSGDLPSIEDLIDQCKSFHKEFYNQIEVLKKKHRKNADANSIPEILGLKIILHYGPEIGMAQIGNHIKLMGADVITAHRLLKNDLPLDEYILISDDLLDQYKNQKVNENYNWNRLKQSSIDVEHLGKVKFGYIRL